MNLKFLLMVGCCYFAATSICVQGALGDQYFANVRADAVHLERTTNQLGNIEFFNQGTGKSYGIQITLNDGSIVQDSFFYEGGTIEYLQLPKVPNSVDWSRQVGFGPFGFTQGTIKFLRKAGFAVGDYELTGTPIGTVSGKFYVVEFRGILTEGPSRDSWSGVLIQEYPHAGVPERLILGPNSNDDVIGTEAGRNYGAGFTSGEFLITDSTLFGIKQWTWLRGTAVKLGQDIGQTGDLIVEIQSTDSVGAIWQPLGSIPISPDKPSEMFRLKITRK